MKRPNLILVNTCHQEPYTAPQGGWGKPPIVRNPALHAAKLNKELQAAFTADDDRRAHAVTDRHGIYLEFTGPQNGDLVTKSLEDVQQACAFSMFAKRTASCGRLCLSHLGKNIFFLIG